jgi:ComF family protein
MFRRLLSGLVDIVYPKICLSCKVKLKDSLGNELVCGECWGKIKRNTPPFCTSCGRHLEKNMLSKNICANCNRKTLYFDRAFSPCIYDGVVKELVHKFKYGTKDYLGKTLSRLMIEFIKEYNLPMEYIDLVVPVPLHAQRMREREFNQAHVLAEYIAREFDKKLYSAAITRNRPTRTQTDLEPAERFLNVRGSFRVNCPEEIKGKNVLIVDDVLTTGATCSEAAYVLKEAGAGLAFVLTLAN